MLMRLETHERLLLEIYLSPISCLKNDKLIFFKKTYVITYINNLQRTIMPSFNLLKLKYVFLAEQMCYLLVNGVQATSTSQQAFTAWKKSFQKEEFNYCEVETALSK